MSLKATARSYLRDAGTAFVRAKTEVALAILTAVLLSYGIETSHGMEAWPQAAVATFIAFAFAWCGTLANALGAVTSKQRWILTLLGALISAAYLLTIESLEPEAEAWRALLLVGGVALLTFAAPAWMRSTEPASLRLRRINARFMLRAIGIGLYGLALFAGLALALAAINKLFELNLDGEIYGHTLGWIMLVLVPWVIVGGLDSYTQPLHEVSDVARVVHRLTSFLVPPLLVLYFLILYVYALRIAITGELPKNLVSPMVLAAGLLTALALMLFDPPPSEARTGLRMLRFAPALLLPLAPLGLWALLVRVDEYGWTEFRLIRVLLLLLLVALALMATLQLIRRRAFALRVAPTVVGVALLLAAAGPWSVLNIAREDQQTRLADALARAGVDVTRPLPRDTTRRAVTRDLYERINNAGYYLQSHFGEQAVTEVTGVGAGGSSRWGWSLADQFKLVVVGRDSVGWTTHGQLPHGVAVSTSAGTVYRVAVPGARTTVAGSQVFLVMGPDSLQADLRPLAGVPAPGQRRERRSLAPQPVAVTDRTGARRGELIVLDATIRVWPDSVRVMRVEGVLILK